MRSHELLGGKAKWNGKNRRWTFLGGSHLQFCYLDRDEDCQNYQSQQFDLELFDEATQFTYYMIRYMLTRLRVTSDTGVTPFVGMATNPGNIGHSWFKREFVDAGEPEIPHIIELEEGGLETHMFIPAKLSDNKVLEERDPDYRRNLENQPEIVRRQLLEGDWEIAEGVAFTEFRRTIHVIEPFAIPDSWMRFRSLDWGHAKPFCCSWFAVDHDGRMYAYREYYGWNGKNDQGAKLDPEDVAKRIMQMEEGEYIRYAVADDAIFGGRQDNYLSIADQLHKGFGGKATPFTPVGKGPRSRISGKLEVHHRLKWNKDAEGRWDGKAPMLQLFNTCIHTIRTLPNLVLDDTNQEDVDSDLEDHAYDTLRYGCMSQPMIPKTAKQELTRIQRHKQQLTKGKKSLRPRII